MVLTESDRANRRAAARRRATRRRLLGLGALALVLTLAAVAIVSATSRREPTKPARQAVTETTGVFTVTGTKANERRTATVGFAPAGSALPPLRGKTVVIDPGHNGANFQHSAEVNRLVDAGTLRKPCDTTGTQTASGYTEPAYNLDVSNRLAKLLRRAGATVVMTRTTNSGWGPCITERAAIGNRIHADVAISIHADGGPSSGHGFHVIYPPSIKGLTDDIAAASYRLALDVRAAFARGTGEAYSTYVGRASLDVRSDLGGLNLSDIPKVFIETGNMRNAADASRLMTPAYRQTEAAALEQALRRFLARP